MDDSTLWYGTIVVFVDPRIRAPVRPNLDHDGLCISTLRCLLTLSLATINSSTICKWWCSL